ncbi:MAG: M17 family peptidase N-terminal domain-containing protein [Myxococcota bacterium]
MTATLVIEPDPGPIERTRAEVAVVTFFAGDRPLRGSAGRADWRLCGRLSRLLAAGDLEAPGDAALIPTCGGLRAPLLLALALGPGDGFDSRHWEEAAEEAVARCLRLDAATIALPLLEAPAGGRELARRVEALVSGAARALAGGSGQIGVRVIAAPREAAQAAKLLESTRPAELPNGVELRLPARSRRVGAAPAAGAASVGSNLPPPVK